MLIDDKQFSAALTAALQLSDEVLRTRAGSGTSRSYYVVYKHRTFPLKAVLRFAYKRENVSWDKPQSSKAARRLRSRFQILHITKATEKKRLERQRENVDRWSRDGRFRADVLDLYGSTCVISGCSAPDAIDAAHLIGVGDNGEDKRENGIVFRADLHRLFDAKPALMSISPKGMTVHFSDNCRDHYLSYEGAIIQIPKGGPKPKAFDAHWKKFKRHLAK
jgi:hypothetical protein